MREMEECYFSKINKCRCPESSDYATAGPQRIQTIINCSKKDDDNLHQNLQECLDNDSEYSICTHRTCVSTYTSKQQVEMFLKRKGTETTGLFVSARERRRSSMPDFDFKKECLFCGVTCNVNKDPKHSARICVGLLVMNTRNLSKRLLKCAKLVVIKKKADCSFVSNTTCRQYK